MHTGEYVNGRSRTCLFLCRIVPAIVILFAIAASADPAGTGPTTSTGTQVTMSVPFVRESIDEILVRAPLRTRAIPGDRDIPLHRISRRSGATGPSVSPMAEQDLAAPFIAFSPVPSAPVLDINFTGLGNPPAGQDVIPPDTMGAVGPNHLVSLLNSDFGVFDKLGHLLQTIDLQLFWSSLGTAAGEPADFPFDTKVLYDPSSDRFFAVTLGGPNTPTSSWILVAVSSTSDPTVAWNKWAIDADKDNNVQLFNNWADFPGVGLDSNNLYVCANMFSTGNAFQYGKIWVVPKPQLVSGSQVITWSEIRNPAGSSFSMQPAYTFGAAPAEYILFEGSSSQLRLARIDNTSGTPVWHAPIGVNVAPYTSSGSLPGALQSGNDNTIDTSDTRLLNVVYRDGAVWTVHTVQSPAAVKTEVAWYRINAGSGTVLSQGRVSDPARWYYYPSIAVNKDNVAAIGFSGSSATEFVGGYYTLIQPSSGTAEAVALLKPGEAPYWKTFGGTDNRWGDYSATVVDPADDTSFWTLQEYSRFPVAGRSQWGTWWGKFHLSDILPPTGATATVDSATQVTVRWTDAATNETGYVVERKTGAAGTYGVLTSPPLPPNSVAYTDNAGLVAGTTYFYRVGAVGSGGTSYSIEVPVTPTAIVPSSGGGGGCQSIPRSGSRETFASPLFSAVILLLPACALRIRRFSRRRERGVPIRHPLC